MMICKSRRGTNKGRDGGKEWMERTTAVRDDLIVWGERCAWADLAAVGCERIKWLGTFSLSLSRACRFWDVGVWKDFRFFLLISLSWYCDCAVEEPVEAEPLEAVGDDILFRCRFLEGMRKVR
jgi:hypothetical protein